MYYEWPRAKDLDRNNGSRHGGVFHYRIDEGADAFESKPSFVKESMKMKKLAIFVPVTHELMNNSPYAVEQQIQDAVRAEINFAWLTQLYGVTASLIRWALQRLQVTARH